MQRFIFFSLGRRKEKEEKEEKDEEKMAVFLKCALIGVLAGPALIRVAKASLKISSILVDTDTSRRLRKPRIIFVRPNPTDKYRDLKVEAIREFMNVTCSCTTTVRSQILQNTTMGISSRAPLCACLGESGLHMRADSSRHAF